MPVTARLLHRLHETLGDEATNDLLSWWEETATVNRAAVREVADLYFERFNAQLEKGLAEVRAEFGGKLDRGLAEVRSELANQHADLIKWMFIFWAGTVIPLAGLAVALTKF
jgi:hypothetical protein